MTFIKSAKTTTTVRNSRNTLDKMLKRYGATAISMTENIATREIIIRFVIPNAPTKNAPQIPVCLPISITRVYDALYGAPGSAKRNWERQYTTTGIAQAERVAWRNLVLWIDAALSAASLGVQTITEAFFAHTVVGNNGERMVDVIEQMQQGLPSGIQKLLTSTVEPE